MLSARVGYERVYIPFRTPIAATPFFLESHTMRSRRTIGLLHCPLARTKARCVEYIRYILERRRRRETSEE